MSNIAIEQWEIKEIDGGDIVINHPTHGGCVVGADPDGILGIILYRLAQDVREALDDVRSVDFKSYRLGREGVLTEFDDILQQVGGHGSDEERWQGWDEAIDEVDRQLQQIKMEKRHHGHDDLQFYND